MSKIIILIIKDPKGDFPRRCTVTPTIHNCHDATKPQTQKMHGRIKKNLVDRKERSTTQCTWMTLNYLQNMKKKNLRKRTGNPNTRRIYSQDIGMEFGIEKCALFVMKSDKRHLTDGIELQNQDKIRTLAENETYKY